MDPTDIVSSEHYVCHPHAKPSLVEVACALAAQDGSVLANHPEIIGFAAEEILKSNPNADPDDILLFAQICYNKH